MHSWAGGDARRIRCPPDRVLGLFVRISLDVLFWAFGLGFRFLLYSAFIIRPPIIVYSGREYTQMREIQTWRPAVDNSR
jgi:hypothetical protein